MARNFKTDDYMNPSIEEADAALYGDGTVNDIPSSGRVVARPLAIAKIVPDFRQPRRAIPLRVRGEWDGTVNDIPSVLGVWHQLAENALSEAIPVEKLLRGHGDGFEAEDSMPALVREYLELISLAASISMEGLTNPITVVRRGTGWMIETGERRWLAHHLLRLYKDTSQYAKIAAVEKTQHDVWRQASENGARRPLNAIGMARQLALLIMAMYEGDDGVSFDAYEDVVLPGEPDRRFYAQVANGRVYQVKRGMMQRVLDVTGLPSKTQVSRYRALLGIPDEVWVEADMEDWTEGKIREFLTPSEPPENGVRLPIGNLTSEKTLHMQGDGGVSPSPAPSSDESEGYGFPAGGSGDVPRRYGDFDEDEDFEVWVEDEELESEYVDVWGGVDDLESPLGLLGGDDETAMQKASLESTEAISDEWGEGLVLFIKFLVKYGKVTGNKKLEQKARSLLWYSDEDIRKTVVSFKEGVNFWEGILRECQQVVDASVAELGEEFGTALRDLYDRGVGFWETYGDDGL